jgi:peptide/nickel transport system permease protein
MTAQTATGPDPALSEAAVGRVGRRRPAAPAKGGQGWLSGLSVGWLALLAALYLLRPWIAADPTAIDALNRLAPPLTPGHLLGTDNLGRDLFSRIVHGTPYSLSFGLLPTVIAVLAGGAIGLVAGYSGRLVNGAIMRLMDVFYAFPPILIALAIIGALGSGFSNCIVALTVVLIPPVARVMESATVQVRGLPYIEAAQLAGAASWRIALVQLLPNVLPPVLAYVTSIIGIMIIIGAGLSFLGLGVETPTPEWGVMLNDLRTAMFINPVVAATPGVFIFLTSLAFSNLGQALERRWSLTQR